MPSVLDCLVDVEGFRNSHPLRNRSSVLLGKKISRLLELQTFRLNWSRESRLHRSSDQRVRMAENLRASDWRRLGFIVWDHCNSVLIMKFNYVDLCLRHVKWKRLWSYIYVFSIDHIRLINWPYVLLTLIKHSPHMLQLIKHMTAFFSSKIYWLIIYLMLNDHMCWAD